MRVLHLFKDYYPPTRGGIEQWIHEIVHAPVFADAGISFDVLTASHDGTTIDETDDGVRVVRAPAIVRASTAPVVPSWSSWIRRLQPDVLHVHMPNPTGELAVLGSRTRGVRRSGPASRAPIVASYHADIVRRGPLPHAYDVFARRFLRRAHTVTVSSPRLAETTPALRDVRDRIAIVPFGVDAVSWAMRPVRADDIRERYGSPLVVLLVRAMRDVDAKALIVGDGPMREGAELLAKELGVSERVVFTGAVDDADRPAYLHAADVFVLPSTNRGEAYGIVQVQAMATGTPSVSTEVGTGTSWVNRHGETGLVVPSNDPVALASAINELLRDDRRRAAMGRAARERVERELTSEAMFDALRGVYERAARAKP